MMLTFILAIIGLFVIIGIISILSDFKNSAMECIIGIAFILVLYGLITGVMDFMFWLGYQIGPPYAILVTILLIVSPFVIFFVYGKLKSNESMSLLASKIKENKKIAYISIIIVLLIVILAIVVPIVTYNPLNSEPYTFVCPENYSIHKDEIGFPTFDDEFNGFISCMHYPSEIKIWHHNAHGKNSTYFLNKLKNDIKVDKIKNISIDGEPSYKINGHWSSGLSDNQKFVISVHDNEYYLIYFADVPKEIEKEFLDSLKFK